MIFNWIFFEIKILLHHFLPFLPPAPPRYTHHHHPIPKLWLSEGKIRAHHRFHSDYHTGFCSPYFVVFLPTSWSILVCVSVLFCLWALPVPAFSNSTFHPPNSLCTHSVQPYRRSRKLPNLTSWRHQHPRLKTCVVASLKCWVPGTQDLEEMSTVGLLIAGISSFGLYSLQCGLRSCKAQSTKPQTRVIDQIPGIKSWSTEPLVHEAWSYKFLICQPDPMPLTAKDPRLLTQKGCSTFTSNVQQNRTRKP